MRNWTVLALAASFGWAISTPVFAQEAKPAAPPKAEQAKDPVADEAKKKADEAKKKGEEYDKFVKDLKKFEGALTLYQKGKQIFLELPDDKLGQTLLAQATWNTGAGTDMLQAGDPINSVDAFRFEKVEDKIWLYRPNQAYRWSKDDPLALSSSRSFPEAILAQYAITQTHPEKKLSLVDVSSFFLGDVFKVNMVATMGLMGQYMLDREKTQPDKITSFPENSIVRMNMHFVSQGGGGGDLGELMAALGMKGPALEDARSAPLKITYNLWFRKDSGYVPRSADPRVGYFTNDFYSVRKFNEFDRQERYINRWNLKKKDPKATLSEPIKPILWTIDPSIPKEWWPAVKDGVLMWNKAFEKLGYKNAVQVQEPVDDKDYDHADGRYNVIRLTMTEDAGYAVALFRTDPLSGEIVNASVTIDANVLQYALFELGDYAAPSASSRQRALDVLSRDDKRTSDDFHLWATDVERAQAKIRAIATKRGHECLSCDFRRGLASQAAFGYAVGQASGTRIDREKYLYQLVREFVVHEVGHCLGLRHNFAASTQLTVDQLGNDALTSEVGLSSSVMDYNPVNTVAILRGTHNYYAPVIGAYDAWAIKYGYTDFGAKESWQESNQLRSIAAQSTQPGHAFMTDEDADSFNPYAVRFDFARDPVRFSKTNVDAAKRMRKYAMGLPSSEGPRRTRLVLTSLNRIFREGRLSTRFLGGVVSKRDLAQGSLSPVDPQEQREAAQLIASSCFDAKVFDLPTEIRNSLAQDRGDEKNATWQAPLRDMFGTQMSMLYAQSMSASTLDRIAENEFKWNGAAGAYTMAEHYDTLLGAVFSELNSSGPVNPLRRDLQQFAVSALIIQAGASVTALPTDAKMLATAWLRKLSSRLDQKRGDRMTDLHFSEMKLGIDRFLERKATGQ